MKLIITSTELSTEFQRLAKHYKEYYWATAWAGVRSPQFDALRFNEAKLRKMVVGLHFYQTHPEFIKAFQSNGLVKFIKQPQGTFHPKIYLFYTSTTEWELLMGSANFTKEAFSRNTEATMLVRSQDDPENAVLKHALALISSSWDQASTFTPAELEKYWEIWKIHQPKLGSLSGTYGEKDLQKIRPLHQVTATSLTWKEYIRKIKASRSMEERLLVIELAQRLFARGRHFAELSLEERKFIAGIDNNLPEAENMDWGFFGSMVGAGTYKNRIIQNDPGLSLALDQIPLSGNITEHHYLNFVTHYRHVFPGNYLATATRLLAMKRPDIFYCFTSENKEGFCKDFNLRPSAIKIDSYWEKVTMRIMDSIIWNSAPPVSLKERRVHSARAAFLDALYYTGG